MQSSAVTIQSSRHHVCTVVCRICKCFVEHDRLTHAEESGYETTLLLMQPKRKIYADSGYVTIRLNHVQINPPHAVC
jgi:hypothetical protein